MSGSAVGVLRKVDPLRRFGFIRCERTDLDHFFHANGCIGGALAFDALAIGMRVTFTPTETPRGLRGEDVRRISG